MVDAATIPPSPPHRVGALDWSMLLLASISVGLLVFDAWGKPSEEARLWITRADYSVCAVFATEFVWRWSRSHWSWGYVRRNWYDVLGMIPVASPALRGFRLIRLVRILILLSRFGMAADRALGEEVTYRFVNRFKGAIVDAVSGAVTLAVLDEVGEVLVRGTYTTNVADALRENDQQIRRMIVDKLRSNPKTGRLRRVPFYDEIVESLIDAVMEVVQDVLRDDRSRALVADILKDNLRQIRAAVERNQGPPLYPGGPLRAANATVLAAASKPIP